MYLQTGTLGKYLAYVLGPLIKNLVTLGYERDKTLFALPVCIGQTIQIATGHASSSLSTPIINKNQPRNYFQIFVFRC